MENSNSLLQLSEEDNVLVLTMDVTKGDTLSFKSWKYTVSESIELGHKIAFKKIRKGEHIIKYGVSIGSATKEIKKGEHVHTHNMKSDFIPTHTRNNEK